MTPLRFVLLALLLLILGAGLAGHLDAATVAEFRFTHQDRERSYRLMVPKGHDKEKAVPLVLALHGGGGTAAAFDRSTRGQFSREADKRGWVVVFPQGIEKGWNDGREISDRRARRRAGVDDVDFIRAVIDRVHASHGIDKQRVYATGISNGGFMSIRLALDLSDRIAAVAPVTAQLQKAHDGKRPKHPVGVMIINGTSDPLVPYEGGHVSVFRKKRGAIFSTDETIRRWRTWNKATQADKPTQLPDNAPLDGLRTTRLRYTAPAGGAEVILLRVEGGGHTWPGGRHNLPTALVGRQTRDFEAVPVIFEFFARHRRTPATAPTTPPPTVKPVPDAPSEKESAPARQGG